MNFTVGSVDKEYSHTGRRSHLDHHHHHVERAQIYTMKDRFAKVVRSAKNKAVSILQPSRPASPSSIDVDSSSRSDNNTAARDTGTSNALFDDRPSSPDLNSYPADASIASTETDTLSPSISVSVPPLIHDMHIEHGSFSSSRTKTRLSLEYADSSMSLFDNAQNVLISKPTIHIDNSVHYASNTDRNERTKSQILVALRENLLPRAQFAEYDAASPAPRNRCTGNTRKTILDELQVWVNDKTALKVYWLNGMAGTGKTTIAYSFSQILLELDSLGGSFFSSHLRVDTSDVHCIVPTISLQLAQKFPSLSRLILEVVEENPDCSSWRIGKQFLKFIVGPLTATNSISREVAVPVIVLDALDECSDQALVAELVSLILKYSASLPVKFFITSRPEMVLKESFNGSQHHLDFILHEVGREIVKADIETYIEACLSDCKVSLSRVDLERLANMAGTLFIYAATVCKYITQRGSLSAPQRLVAVVNLKLETASGITQPLDILYKRILDTVYDTANQMEKEDIHTVLEAVVYVYNPLSVTGISVLVQMPVEQVEAVLASLQSLIYVPSPQRSTQQITQQISILHASFYDFISTQVLSSKYYLDPCASHAQLALCCLSLMKKEWSHKESVSYLAERKSEDISEALAYACDSWAFHFIKSNDNEWAELKHFFENYLLRWIDCLSISQKLKTAIHSLQRLKKWANTQKQLAVIIMDAESFLQENFDFIKQNSLEGCPSALAWLPEQSHIWKTYGSRVYCPWKLCTGRREAWNPCKAVLKHSADGHVADVTSVVFSPNSIHIVSASGDCTARVWNAATGDCEVELRGHTDKVNSAVFSADGMHIISASNDWTARVWNAATGDCEAELKGHSAPVNIAFFSPNGIHIVSASYDNTARVWNAVTGVCEAELKGHSHWINSIVLSPDHAHIVTASNDRTARVWNRVTGECKAELKGHSARVESVAFSPDGTHFVSASDDSTARVWNAASRKCEVVLEHSGCVISAVFSPNSMYIVSASYDHTAKIWKAATGECEVELKGHSSWINSVAFSPDSMHVVSASQDCTARVWNAATGYCEAELKGHSSKINSVCFSPDGTDIVSGSSDGTARVWNADYKAEINGHSSDVNFVVFSPSGKDIVSASDDQTARVWNAVTGDCKAELKGHSAWVNYVAFSFDSTRVVSASVDRTARVWNAATGDCEAELKGHSDLVNTVFFSPNGMHIVSASNDHTARVWNAATGVCEAELKGHLHRINIALFAPDGMHIGSGSDDHSARIWNATTGNCEAVLKGHKARVKVVAFSPDSRHIVSASVDHKARVWNTATGECEAELKGHSAGVDCVVFSSDGMHIVSASNIDCTARVWNVATGECEANIGLASTLLSSNNSHPAGVSIHQDASNKFWLLQPSSLTLFRNTIFYTQSQKIHIPPLYCHPRSMSFHRFHICLGYESGEVLLLKFQP